MEGLRRIVTGHNADGKSIVIIDGPPARQITDSEEVGGLFEIWNTDGNQINTLDKIDRADTDVLLSPPKGGSKFRYFALNHIPKEVPKEKLEELAAIFFAEIGASQDRVDTTRHPGMHKTKTKGFEINYSKVIPEHIFPWNKYVLYPQNQVFYYPWPQTNTFVENSEINCPEGIPQELTVEYWFNQNNVVFHPNSEHYFQPRAGRIKFETIAEGDDQKKSYKRLHRWRYSPTACYGNNEVHLHPYKVRRLSVAEALAIQSLPKKFALPNNMTLSHKFKTIGNGVPYLAAQGVAKTILCLLDMKNVNYQEDLSHQLELPLVYSPKSKYVV